MTIIMRHIEYGACVPWHVLQTEPPNWVDFFELEAAGAFNADKMPTRMLRAAKVLRRAIPDHISIFEDDNALDAYFTQTSLYFSKMHADTIVIGSGPARMVPPGMRSGAVADRWRVFLSACRDAWAPLRLLIEPLDRSETNFINSLREVEPWLGLVDGVVMDVLHVGNDPDLREFARDYPRAIAHVHVAGLGRRAPIEEDWMKIEAFLARVFSCGAQPRISLELPWRRLEPSLEASVDRLRDGLSGALP